MSAEENDSGCKGTASVFVVDMVSSVCGEARGEARFGRAGEAAGLPFVLVSCHGVRRWHNAGHGRPCRANTVGSRLGPSSPTCLPVGPFATTLEENDIS